jgi:hypothetical protein
MNFLSRHRKHSESRSYFEHLCGEYYALPSDPARDEGYVKHIDHLIKKNTKDETQEVDWDEMFQLELLLLRLMPKEKLQRKAWLIQKRWRSVVSPEARRLYDLSLKKDHKQGHEELLADLEVLLQDLFWHYRSSTAWEEQSGKFANTGWLLLLILLAALIAVSGLLFKVDSTLSLHLDWNVILTALAVAFSGAVGGVLSMLQRLKKVSDEMHRSSQLIAIESSRSRIILQAMLTGSVFALVLWLMFAGGLLSGSLFPDLLKEKLLSLNTLNSVTAKLLVWAFIAGFAERFVPDLLDKLSLKASEGGTETAKDSGTTPKKDEPTPPANS